MPNNFNFNVSDFLRLQKDRDRQKQLAMEKLEALRRRRAAGQKVEYDDSVVKDDDRSQLLVNFILVFAEFGTQNINFDI